jgi:hypothetical protein
VPRIPLPLKEPDREVVRIREKTCNSRCYLYVVFQVRHYAFVCVALETARNNNFSDAARDRRQDNYAANNVQRCLMQLKRDVRGVIEVGDALCCR